MDNEQGRCQTSEGKRSQNRPQTIERRKQVCRWRNLTAFCGEHWGFACMWEDSWGGQNRRRWKCRKCLDLQSWISNCLFVFFQQFSQWTLSLFSHVSTGTLGIGRLNNMVFFSDEDECATGRHNCQHTCVNTPGSFRCGCPDGYMRNGITCVGKWNLLENPLDLTGILSLDLRIVRCFLLFSDKDECMTDKNICGFGMCENLPGSYRCTCNQGYKYDEKTKKCVGQ